MTRIFLRVRLEDHYIVEKLLDNVRNLVVIVQYIIPRDELDHRFFYEVNRRYKSVLKKVNHSFSLEINEGDLPLSFSCCASRSPKMHN